MTPWKDAPRRGDVGEPTIRVTCACGARVDARLTEDFSCHRCRRAMRFVLQERMTEPYVYATPAQDGWGRDIPGEGDAWCIDFGCGHAVGCYASKTHLPKTCPACARDSGRTP